MTTTTERDARRWLNAAAEPGIPQLYDYVTTEGPVAAYEALSAGKGPEKVQCTLRPAPVPVVGAPADVRFVVPEDEEWPAGLDLYLSSGTMAPPLGLWVRGMLTLDALVGYGSPAQGANPAGIALVGSRAATAYGEHVASDLAQGLAQRGYTIVSGGAYGIDAAAHRGAIATTGGGTIAVLASGVDRPFPAAHAPLFARIVETGGLLVSEYPPGAAPLRHRFLARNRLIALLSTGVVVVEAAARSGSSAAARRALEAGRIVMAVPGPVTSAMSVGTHTMIREGWARMVTSTEDVVAAVGA